MKFETSFIKEDNVICEIIFAYLNDFSKFHSLVKNLHELTFA